MWPELAAAYEQVTEHVQRDDADHADVRQSLRAAAKAKPDVDMSVIMALYDEHVKATTTSHDRLLAAIDDWSASL